MNSKFPVVDSSFPVLVPPFREFVKILRECEESGTPFACAKQELRVADAILAAFAAGFKQSVRGYDYDEEEADIIARVCSRFDVVGDMMMALYAILDGDDQETVVKGVAAIVEHLRFVEQAIRTLHDREASKEKYSSVPGIDALLRAGYAILEGRRDWGILETRLESMRPMIENVVAHEDNPPLLAEHCDAVVELFRVRAEEDIDALEQALAMVKETGEALIEERAAAAEEEEPVSNLLCPRCGASISPWDKNCPSCHGRLPERLEESVDRGCSTRQLELPEYVQKLFSVVERVRAGEQCWSEYDSAVNELRRRVVQTRGQVDNIPPVPANAPADELEAVDLSREAIDNGMSRFLQALDLFDSINPNAPLNVSILDCAVDAVIAGVEETRQVNVAIQRLLDARGMS